jgi:hypothetical protein
VYGGRACALIGIGESRPPGPPKSPSPSAGIASFGRNTTTAGVAAPENPSNKLPSPVPSSPRTTSNTSSGSSWSPRVSLERCAASSMSWVVRGSSPPPEKAGPTSPLPNRNAMSRRFPTPNASRTACLSTSSAQSRGIWSLRKTPPGTKAAIVWGTAAMTGTCSTGQVQRVNPPPATPYPDALTQNAPKALPRRDLLSRQQVTRSPHGTAQGRRQNRQLRSSAACACPSLKRFQPLSQIAGER